MATIKLQSTQDHALSFENWLEHNEQELTCIAAETGRDRELGFDREAFEDAEYEKYLAGFQFAGDDEIDLPRP